MTDGEKAIWAAAYGAAWQASKNIESHAERARWAAREASKALDLLKEVVSLKEGTWSSGLAAEVLQ